MARSVTVDLFTTSNFNFSSDQMIGVSSGINAGDKINSTSIGLGNITTSMIVGFYGVTGGTVAAGLSSNSEYQVVNPVTATSSFQVYAINMSSANEITADSSGSDYWYKIINSSVINVSGAEYMDVAVYPTTGYSGQFRFVGSDKADVKSDALPSINNRITTLNYYDRQASGTAFGPLVSSGYVDSSGGTATSNFLFRVDTRGLETVWMRTRLCTGGAITAKGTLYYEI